jgi:hypothetical protein
VAWLVVLVALLAVLQLTTNVLGRLRWRLPGIDRTVPLAIINRCPVALELSEGGREPLLLRPGHEQQVRLSADTPLRIARSDAARFVIAQGDLMAAGEFFELVPESADSAPLIACPYPDPDE